MTVTTVIDFEKKLALHTAPTLLGIKPANLVSLNRNEFDISENTRAFNSRAGQKGLKIKILCKCREKVLILVYNEKMLFNQLCESDRQELLEEFGYSREFSLYEYLDSLSKRIEENNEFPHEIGLFLGYPTEDVIGFIENRGNNFKFCGYWKVYSDEKIARRTFDNYTKCRLFICNKLNQGADIYQALKIS